MLEGLLAVIASVARIAFGLGAFAVVWLLMLRYTALLGWDRYAARHACADPVPAGARHFPPTTLVIGNSSFTGQRYRSGMHVALSDDGFYLWPSAFYRAFHPMLRIAYGEMTLAARRPHGFVTEIEVRCDPALPSLWIFGEAGEALLARAPLAARRAGEAVA